MLGLATSTSVCAMRAPVPFGITADEDGADLVFGNEPFRAKHVIAADGRVRTTGSTGMQPCRAGTAGRLIKTT